MNVLYENIPAELKALDQWVCWRYERGTKMLKVAGTLRNAKSTSPETWSSFSECVAAHETRYGRYAGIGFVFAEDDPYVGVDLDDLPPNGGLRIRAREPVEPDHGNRGVRRDLERAWAAFALPWQRGCIQGIAAGGRCPADCQSHPVGRRGRASPESDL